MKIERYLMENDFDLFIEYMERSFATNGARRFFDYLNDIFDKDFFNSQIKKIREKYKIMNSKFFLYGSKTFPPDGWQVKNREKCIKEIDFAIIRICKKYKLDYRSAHFYIRDYIFYDEKLNKKYLPIGGPRIGNLLDLEITKNKDFPLSVVISPYASEREIISYIKTMNPVIKKICLKFSNKKVPLGKSRSKNESLRELYDFIYKSRLLPIKKICELVKLKYNKYLDQGYVSKIISLEKKRRR